MRKVQKMKKKQGFTLVELLVVVAIIAVIGAGIAVTYQNLDDQAKTAMEMSDMSALKKVVKHWSAVNDYKLPTGFDSLVDANGILYTDFTMADNSFAEVDASDKGINGPLGYATLEVAEAPDRVLENLSVAGLTTVYTHLLGATIANDSTFETGMGGSVNTDNTLTSLVTGDTETRDHADAIVAGAAGAAAFDYDSDGDGTPGESGEDDPYTVDGFDVYSQAAYDAEVIDQQVLLDAKTTDMLAFIYPGGGTTLMGQTAPMNLTDEIISNAGLKPAQVQNPADAPEAGKYYLVAMGFGRFASINQGKAVRTDAPITGKRQAGDKAYYSRYIAIFRVPAAEYSTMTGSSEGPVLVDVLSPQGFSVAALQDKMEDDKDRVQDS